MSKFKQVPSQVDFNALEEEILKYWEDTRTFEKSVDNCKGQKRFVFYEGPPTANGKPGIHHTLVRSMKDLILRYKTMQGFLVERRAGWDTHGLPVEIAVEKELGLKGKQDILSLKENEFESIKFFNQRCKESVFRYVDDWVNLTRRIGLWMDFDNAYISYKNEYIESVWWFLKQVYSEGRLYKDYKVVPYCPRCETPLSSHEVAQGYKDNTIDPSVFIKFELVDEPGTCLLVWTTTPWTLPGNVALTVGEKVGYVKVEQGGTRYILARKRLGILDGEYKVLGEVEPEELVGKSYKPLYSYLNPDRKAYYVAAADFATEEEGTGIVHTAVMYGVDDFDLGKRLNLPFKHTVDLHGKMMPEVEKFAGLFAKVADKEIIKDLQERGLLYKSETVEHTYPFCWRCGTPLLYYALDAWFIKTTSVKNLLLEDNQKINWVPKTIKTGRMNNWLETLIDWNISRNRFWATPLPIWVCGNGHVEVVGGREELEKLGGKVIDDLHRPFIDEVVFDCPQCEEEMKRVPEVADVWMDSGAMPFAQWHYPFENQEIFKQWYPADFIVEAIDQTRGWFFTLMAEAMLLKNTPPAPFKSVLTTGLILDENGQKMSKSKGNVVDPWEVIRVSGADTMRWYMYTGAPAGANYIFSKEILQEKYRRFTLILWNCYKFFVDYAILTDWSLEKNFRLEEGSNVLDRWILVRLNQLVGDVSSCLEKYDAMNASRTIENFVVNDLSTWYIRRSRGRVGPSVDKEDEKVFLSTLCEVLVTVSKLLAPFMPFIAEEIYKNLTGQESVHLENYPEVDESAVDRKLVDDMEIVRGLAEIGHSQRKEANIKLRQPLQKVTYGLKEKLDGVLEKVLADELNVKQIEYKLGSEFVLDTKITPELQAEGEARELVRQIQSLRKEMGLTLKDKIKVTAPNVPEKEEFVRMLTRQTNASKISEGKELSIEVVK